MTALDDLLAAQIDGRADRAQAAVDAATQPHAVRWYGVLPDGERVARNRHMNGGDWGWDAVCSCGWDSRTGGAIQERIRDAIADHRADVAYAARQPAKDRHGVTDAQKAERNTRIADRLRTTAS